MKVPFDADNVTRSKIEYIVLREALICARFGVEAVASISCSSDPSLTLDTEDTKKELSKMASELKYFMQEYSSARTSL
jgi:hypothetical protein